MTDIKATARQVMAGKLIADTVTDAMKPAKAELFKALTDAGVERVRVKGDDDTNYGVVYIAGGGELKAKVTDEAAFTTWVADRYPSEVVTVVRESFAKKLLDGATREAQQVPVDARTGEVIPGVEMRIGSAYLAVRPTDMAKELMADTLGRSDLLALTSGLGEVPDAAS